MGPPTLGAVGGMSGDRWARPVVKSAWTGWRRVCLRVGVRTSPVEADRLAVGRREYVSWPTPRGPYTFAVGWTSNEGHR